MDKVRFFSRRKYKFHVYRQMDAKDCGAICVRMVARHFGKIFSLQYLRDRSYITREGVSLMGISEAAEHIGLRSHAARVTIDQLRELPLPCIVHWNQNHFVVVYAIEKNTVYVADPAYGLLTYSIPEFVERWAGGGTQKPGIVLLLEPTPAFHAQEDESASVTSGFKFLFSYLFSYKRYLTQLFIGIFVGSLLQLTFPFLTQSLVDFGINNQDVDFVYAILLAQLMLFFSRTTVEIIRGWILLHIGTRINISIISDFLIKLMRLPLSFFDTRMIGDLLQRIGDHHRIERFLTSSTLNILFSLLNLVIFGIVLAIYSMTIFGVFCIGTLAYAAWILLFLKKRKELDYKRFSQLSNNQSTLIQLINGMQEIKLNGSERQKRWEWEHIQAKLFKVNIKGLALNQYQQAGALFLNELKNILITFLAAKSVIDGSITLGMMLAIQYIIGQLNSPVSQLIGFIGAAQDAKISLERMSEIHGKENEEQPGAERADILPVNKDISIRNLSYQYEGPHSKFVLRNLTLDIPGNQVTAIVGASGSGKTTLLKLLLKFYNPTEGEIRLSDINLHSINSGVWRRKCGVVMQDGFIFADTIAKNIAMGEETIDRDKLLNAVKLANIQEFVESLPLGYNTNIGQDGHGLSQGQKQRILIARALYKDPEFLFFDEATSALDANNERVIMDNLTKVFHGKTAVVIAHRLSTVKKADQIVVLDRGQIVEKGSHEELAKLRGYYFDLVKNQLELGA